MRGDVDAVALAGYLFTCPAANMIGLYYLPIPDLAHGLGMEVERAREALQRVCENGFAKYDEVSEYVFVLNAAREQVAKELTAKDNRVKGVIREALKHKKAPFFIEFLARYWTAYSFGEHLDPALLGGIALPSRAPLEALSSQDHDQETDQEIEPETDDAGPLDLPEGEKPNELEPGEPPQRWRDTGHMVRVMFERRYQTLVGPVAWSRKNVEHVRAIVEWLEKKGGHRERIFERVLDGFFRNTWVIDRAFPLGALANGPERYLTSSAGVTGFAEPSLAKAYKQTDLSKAFGPVKQAGGM